MELPDLLDHCKQKSGRQSEQRLDRRQLPELVAGLDKMLASANKRCCHSLNSGYDDNTKFNSDLDRLMVQANEAVSTIRALATCWRAIRRR